MESNLKHIVITNTELSGFQYGTLRDFEDEISRITGADQVSIPTRKLPQFISKRISQGTKYGSLRQFVPKIQYNLNADVAWLILMGPENYKLDLFKNWNKHIGIKILYIFDTFESQIPLIQRILKSAQWDITITSFHGAVSLLEKMTQRKWYAIPQGVKLDRFYPTLPENRIIDFCAYGRRVNNIHKILKDYCLDSQKYYDYTTSLSVQSDLDPREYYKQYAWHINHSFFNFCWPVELTHPDRVLTFSPITCRWFEAAASCNVIIGKQPQDPTFVDLFGTDLVIDIDDESEFNNVKLVLDELWNNRNHYFQSAINRRKKLSYKWSWESKVLEIINLIDKSSIL